MCKERCGCVKGAASHAYFLIALDKLIRQPLHIPFISAPVRRPHALRRHSSRHICRGPRRGLPGRHHRPHGAPAAGGGLPTRRSCGRSLHPWFYRRLARHEPTRRGGRHVHDVRYRPALWLKCRISSDSNAWISTSHFRQRWCEGVGTPARNARWWHECVSAADICRFYKRAYSSISSVTGQWSLPKMSLRMPVLCTRSAIESLTRK